MNTFDFTFFPQMETERLILRQITREDRDDWRNLHLNPEVLRYLIDFEGEPPEEEVEEMITWSEDVFANKHGMRWAITRKPSDQLIGSCGFHLYDAKNRFAEIGYELHYDYWGQRIMREAVTELLHFMFTQLNLHRVEANVTVGNAGSAGLLKSLGFTHEGTWRERVFVRGRFWDLWQFGLLESEFQK